MATSLNGVDSTGVGEEAIREVSDVLAWLADDSEAAPEKHEFLFGGFVVCNARDAVFAVKSLLAAGIPPSPVHNNNSSSNSSNSSISSTSRKKKLTLVFEWDHQFNYQGGADEVVNVFVEFLRGNPNFYCLEMHSLPEPNSPFPIQPFRRILEALHDNTSVKDFSLYLYYSEPYGDEYYEECMQYYVDCISNLLQHKDDFQHLHFQDCPYLAGIVPGLRRPHKHLQSLWLEANNVCQIDDEGIRKFLGAMQEGDFPALEGMYLDGNCITRVGLQSITELLPKAAPHLQKLYLKRNRLYDDDLLADEEITKDFAVRVLSSGDMEFLKELHVDDVDGHSVHIIKALEHDKASLEVLDFGRVRENHQVRAICNQLMESITKMKSLRRIAFSCNVSQCFFTGSGIDASLFQNTSIVEFVTTELYEDPSIATANAEFHARVAPIFHRNRDLAHILGLSQPRPQPTVSTAAGSGSGSSDDEYTTDTVPVAAPTVPTAVIPVPRGQWSRILATVGHEESRYGAMPVFHFLKDSNRLASWVSSTTYEANRKKDSTNRKHEMDGHHEGEHSTSSIVVPKASSTK